jgi:predicted dehydrogenase
MRIARKSVSAKTRRTVLIGFGRIAAGYASDQRMARWFPFATHAQVLSAHPAFEWAAVVDPNPVSQSIASLNWAAQEVVGDVTLLDDPGSFEIAILATPPQSRQGLLEYLPNLKGVIVEKPLGLDFSAARMFLDACADRGILVQVNFPRRGDKEMRRLASGLTTNIGQIQAATVLYGNGLNNNGSHIVDWVRMFLGEVAWVRAIPEGPIIKHGPIPGDISIPFCLGLESGLCLMAQPLNFSNYRENSLDIWGERGRLSFWQEGLTSSISHLNEHRFMEGQCEIASDNPKIGLTRQGDAMFQLYSNLDYALNKKDVLWSDGKSALRVMKILEAIHHSFSTKGSLVTV